MINQFWEQAGLIYKIVVFSALGLMFMGVFLTIIGATTGNNSLQVAALPVIGVGLVLHVAGMFIRGQSIRRKLREK